MRLFGRWRSRNVQVECLLALYDPAVWGKTWIEPLPLPDRPAR